MNALTSEWVEKAESDYRATFRTPILLLNDYSVDIRYPGETATKEEARAAVGAMRAVRDHARQDLGL